MWIIQWLQDRWNRLLYILEYYYYRLIDLARFTLQGIINYISARVNSALDFAKWVLARAEQIGRDWGYWARSQAESLFYNLRSWAQGRLNDLTATVNWVSGKIEYLWTDITGWIDKKIIPLWDWVKAQFEYYKSWYNNLFTALRSWAEGKIKEVTTWAGQQISSTINSIAAEAKKAADKLDTFRSGWEPILSNFFPNMGASIFGIIEAHLWGWLDWWLGMLLWGLDTPAPKRPDLFGLSPFEPTPVGPLPPLPATGFVWPTPTTFISGYQFSGDHPGIDIGINTGDPIRAITEGLVNSMGTDNTGYGIFVRLDHPGGWTSLYAHLHSILVSQGQHINRGDVIALGNSTGHSTGPHLHLEIRKNGSPVDPQTVLTK